MADKDGGICRNGFLKQKTPPSGLVRTAIHIDRQQSIILRTYVLDAEGDNAIAIVEQSDLLSDQTGRARSQARDDIPQIQDTLLATCTMHIQQADFMPNTIT
jgi:hypothetical protein